MNWITDSETRVAFKLHVVGSSRGLSTYEETLPPKICQLEDYFHIDRHHHHHHHKRHRHRHRHRHRYRHLHLHHYSLRAERGKLVELFLSFSFSSFFLLIVLFLSVCTPKPPGRQTFFRQLNLRGLITSRLLILVWKSKVIH